MSMLYKNILKIKIKNFKKCKIKGIERKLMEEELVSVIIPAYNVGDYLEECIQSLVCQTYTTYEIIIIDDGSTDNTYDVGKGFTLYNTKIKIFHQENQGVSIARNIGMQKANGKYYIFVDADDIVMPQYIESLVKCIEKADMGMISFTSEREKLTNNIRMNIVYNNASDMIEGLLCEEKYDGYLWNKIFKKNIIEDNRLMFKKNIAVWEDLLFVLEYLKYCNKIAISDDKLYYYRYREGSAVNNFKIDKYRSKYEVMAEIRRQKLCNTNHSRKRISFLYFETMFSYLNQIIIKKNELNKINKVLLDVNIIDLLKQRDVILFIKYLYLKIKSKVISINYLFIKNKQNKNKIHY